MQHCKNWALKQVQLEKKQNHPKKLQHIETNDPPPEEDHYNQKKYISQQFPQINRQDRTRSLLTKNKDITRKGKRDTKMNNLQQN
jgi:hypothetical protein